MATYYFRNVGTDWNTASNWSLTDGGGADGAVPTAADDAYFTSNSGNCTISTASRVCLTLIFSGVGAGNYAGTFTLNNTLTVAGNITLSSSMTFDGTSTITINANSTITSNTKVFPCNITISGTRTITLGDDVYVTGNVLFGAGSPVTATFNNNTLFVGGSFGTSGLGSGVLNSNLTMNGTGTFGVSQAFSGSLSGTGTISFNTTGTITITGTTISSGASGRTIQYISGIVLVPRPQNLAFLSTGNGIMTLNLKGMTITGGLTLASQGSFSLISDLIVDGSDVTFGSSALSGSQALVINNNGGNLYLGDSALPGIILNGASTLSGISGTAKIFIRGGGNGRIILDTPVNCDITFDFTGILTFINNTFFGNERPALIIGVGRYTFLNGRASSTNSRGVKNQGVLNISGNATLIGFDKFSGIGNISINNGLTLTMDKFFSGRPDCITNVFCGTTTGAYTITFQDTFEKFANWLKLSNCTLTRIGQLIVLNQKATTITGRNVGVRYQNVWPNGIPKNSPFTSDVPMAYGANGLVSDPTRTL
jgi:hypothetical protein